MTQPTITIIGRINTGKSTLFNKLTQTNDALTNSFPGLTRDRKYGDIIIKKEKISLIDTAGWIFYPKDIGIKISQQTKTAIKEANLILFIVNSQDGLMPEDTVIAKKIRSYQKKTIIVVNKSENLIPQLAIIEFYSLGFKNVHSISATHGTGIDSLLKKYIIPMKDTYLQLNKKNTTELSVPQKKEKNTYINLHPIKIAVLGKPNAGKSTLINSCLKEERLITHRQPGTTRNAIWTSIEHSKKKFIFIDTAGIKKRNTINDNINKIVKDDTFKNIRQAHVVLVVIDAKENISDQDLSLCNAVLKIGRAIIIIINKCDLLTKEKKKEIKKNINYKLRFLKFANIHYISAINKIGLNKIFKSICITYKSIMHSFNTSQLTKIMQMAIKKQEPPMIKGNRIKLKYAHPGGYNPPIIIIHGTKTKYLNHSYKKYLKNYFQNMLSITGSSVSLYFKDNINPYNI